MDLLQKRQEKDKRNQNLVQEVLRGSQTNRYQFGSAKEMILIRNLIIKKILTGKVKTESDKENTLKVLESLNEYFYVEDLEQLDPGDYLRYFSFKTSNLELSFELKMGGYFVKQENNFIVLRSTKHISQDEKPSYWKISSNTPVFCRLNDQDKMILVLMEKTSYENENNSET